MVQVKISGLAETLNPIKARLSDLVHQCLQTAIGTPPEKRFQRFFPLDAEDFYFPDSRSRQYLIIEIVMFEGRSVPTKKKLIRQLFESLDQSLNIDPQDVEIVIFDLPQHNWGIRGYPGDELMLNYVVDV